MVSRNASQSGILLWQKLILDNGIKLIQTIELNVHCTIDNIIEENRMHPLI